MKSPTPKQIAKARKAADLSPRDAAALIHCSERAWIKWERGERKMHAAFWELWQIKVKR